MNNPVTETRTFGAEISKVLHLMIHSLYTNRDIFLRELISNASDACDKLRYGALTKPEMLEKQSDLRITLSANSKTRIFTITDTGIGMSRDEMINNLGTIAKSGTQEFISALSGDAKKDMPLIGQFGVGFYSAFMVADKVKVISCKAGEPQSHEWESDGLGEYTITEGQAGATRGTTIMLWIKKGKDFDIYLDRFKLGFIAETYSNHISFPIEFIDEEGKVHPLNTGTALWARNKSDITEEQYKEFYQSNAHAPDSPWMVMHNKAEGKIEYTNLLFVPSHKPFDLFHPDRKRRVKLYVRKVFITDENANVIPQWLRFLRGVVDSEDLPLNISRETLQANPVIDKIRDGIVKRFLGDLKKRMKKDAADYDTFWKNFGGVIKEGLCETIAPKEEILEICRFFTTDASGTTSLDDYISRMKPDQQHIFFATGDRLDALQSSPQLEGFRKRGIEVLLFTDHVDDFWVNVVNSFKSKEFKSITRADIDLDKLGKSDDDTEKNDSAIAHTDEIKVLIENLKTIYGDQVKDVRVTHKLEGSPVCLAVGERDMDIRLEQFLRENKQLPDASYAKILEINPDHPIIKKLADKLSKDASNAEAKDVAFLLLDQAKILEGEELTKPADFSRRMSYFLERSLAA
jgi:molecular chaperone HtpG